MPDDVKSEISPFFLDRFALPDETPVAIPKLDDSAQHITSGLTVCNGRPLRLVSTAFRIEKIKFTSFLIELSCLFDAKLIVQILPSMFSMLNSLNLLFAAPSQ